MIQIMSKRAYVTTVRARAVQCKLVEPRCGSVTQLGQTKNQLYICSNLLGSFSHISFLRSRLQRPHWKMSANEYSQGMSNPFCTWEAFLQKAP